ncbi:GspE/PulE/PilB domain-containing protein [Oleomonas cavernae]|uniref:GspE/PulE/PilB domain-containing protein n=1 Tax=Oleomonas cavernae TaxID=2320859 RepID=UPI0013141825|nr:hypothetical protein [Oleomonas cavernae]
MAADRISAYFLRERRAVPVALDDETLTVAVVDPFDATVVDGLRLAARRRVAVEVATASDIEEALARLYAAPGQRPAPSTATPLNSTSPNCVSGPATRR